MEQNNRPPIEANITPQSDIGVHMNREVDGSITLFTIGNIESGGRILKDREIVFTFHSPIHETFVHEDREEYTSQLTKQAQETSRRHTRNSTSR